jgi:mono/diheme cytochrome c family protein
MNAMHLPRPLPGLLIALAALGACATARAADDPLFSQSDHFDQRSGAGVYHAICAGCHQPQGQGAQGAGAYPALAGNPRVASAAYVATMVLYGRKAMPAFAQQLDDAQIAAVVQYLQHDVAHVQGEPLDAAQVAALRH